MVRIGREKRLFAHWLILRSEVNVGLEHKADEILL